MIIFENIQIQNFMSYGNDVTKVDLRRPEPTLITGINYDASSNNELDSNGAGKSSILMAVSVALYDKPLGIDKAKKNDLVNYINNKDMLITLDLKVKKTKYTIHRYRKNKAMGGDGVRIEKNGKDITPDSTVNANKFIAENIMEMPYEIFSKIVIYAAGTESFLKMKLADQRNILEELFSYVELSRKAEKLKEKIKDNKTALQYAKDTNEDIKEEAERYQQQLDMAEEEYDDWEKERERKINYLKKTIKDFSDVDFDAELKKFEELEKIEKESDAARNHINYFASDLKEFQKETDKFNNFETKKQEKIDELTKKINDLDISDDEIEENKKLLKAFDKKREKELNLRTDYSSYEEKISNHEESVRELEMEMKHLEDSNCPYCKQQYEESAKKLAQVEESHKQYVEEFNEFDKQRKQTKEKLAKVMDEITEIKEAMVFDSMDQINELIQKRDKLKLQLAETEKSENPYEDREKDIKDTENALESTKKKFEKANKSMEEYNKKLTFKTSHELYETKNKFEQAEDRLEYLKNETNPHAKLVQNLKDREPKETKDDEIDELIETIDHQEFLLKLLTKKDSFVRKALMDKYLPFLNERLRYYLTKMGLPHKVKFKSDMTTEISQFDKNIGYPSLSSGQKARINIALSLAFRDVLQSKHSFINLFILDECLDVGLSNVGIKKTLKLIKDVAKDNKLSMFVISHRDEVIPAFKDRLNIELRNGFSTVKAPSD